MECAVSNEIVKSSDSDVFGATHAEFLEGSKHSKCHDSVRNQYRGRSRMPQQKVFRQLIAGALAEVTLQNQLS
jgi:hypothetical protein